MITKKSTYNKLNLKNLNNNVVFKFFFIILLLELFLLGSGRLLEFGPLTARMLLFSLALLMSFFVMVAVRKVEKSIAFLILFFLLVVTLATLNGIISDANLNMILLDLKPLSFFLIILYFSLFIKNQKDIITIVTLIKISSILLCFLYFTFLIVMYFGIFDFGQVYDFISNNINSIKFRGDSSYNSSFFYKGFLYLNVGFIFFIFSKKKIDIFASFLLLIAILLTFTRGFVLALFLSFVFQNIIDIKNKKSFILLGLLIFAGLVSTPYFIELMGNRVASDSIRITQIQQVVDNITLVSVFIGHGFGIGIPIREMHMEITYLEIFHKQGLIGVLFWLLPLGAIIFNYINIEKKSFIVKSFFVSALFVYAESATNPFLTNPIGMTVVLLALIVLMRTREMNIKEKTIDV